MNTLGRIKPKRMFQGGRMTQDDSRMIQNEGERQGARGVISQ